MRVIKKGRVQKGWSVEQCCTGHGNGDGGCGAELLVEEGDLFFTYRHHYDGESERFCTFICPECGVRNDVQLVPCYVIDNIVSKGKK